MSLRALLVDCYAPLNGISDRTVRLYGFTLKAFGEFLGEQAGEGYIEPTIDHLDELVVARFLAHRLRQRSVGTAAKDRTQLRAIWEFLSRRGVVKTWPSIRPIRVPERVPRAWLIDEFKRLLASAGEERGEVVGVPARAWWRAILLTAYEVGERIGGLLSIEWGDVAPNGITIRAEGRKGQRRDIWRGISPACYEAVMATRNDRRLVFDWDKSYSMIWHDLGRICERAGLPNDRMSKFHRVRKTTASYAAAGGLDPQKVMDHASPLTTRRYLDPRIVRQPEATDVLPKVS
jgi:integrase